MIDKSGEHGLKIFWQFESLQELFDLKLSEPNKYHDSAFLLTKSGKEAEAQDILAREGFRGGFHSSKDFVEFINRGWSEGAWRMREAMDAIAINGVRSIRRRQIWTDQGDEIDIGRVYNGQLDQAWRGMVRRLGAGGQTHVRILTHVGALGEVRHEDFLWRGAVACLLTDALEEAGYRVELMGYTNANGVFDNQKNGSAAALFPIKGYDEALDIERVAAVTGHAGFHRTVVFGFRMATPYKTSTGFGYSITEGRPAFAQDDDIVVDDVWNAGSANAQLSRLAQQFEAASAT
jgi:hypothetical protein